MRSTGPSARRTLAAPRSSGQCPAGSGKDFAPPLVYCGGTGGTGVVVAQPKVYLVLWGNQWGTQGTNAKGYATFSGDANDTAPLLQSMFAHLGTSGESWSSVLTQYCQDVPKGATSCPATSSARIPYPTNSVLGGVWLDAGGAAPSQATMSQIRDEAWAGAQHFGIGNASALRNAQIVVMSPSGTHPDGFGNGGGFCAWHSYSLLYQMAYTNFPYQPDAGRSCGANAVNAGADGANDGVTITEAHEYAETLSDPAPNGGWLDGNGWENGDICAWLHDQNVTMGDATFALPATWSNDTTSCAISHATILNSQVVVKPIADVDYTKGKAISLQVQATNGGGLPLTYVATGLPSGLAIGSSSGLISGTASPAGTYSVTVTASDSTGAAGTATFTLRVLGVVTLKKVPDQQVLSGKSYRVLPVASDSEGGALTFSNSSLPPGMSLNTSTGEMSGTITLTYGPIQWVSTLTATNSGGASASRTFSFMISMPVLTITKQAARTTRVGANVSFAVKASDTAGAPLTYAARGLPPGLSLNASSGKVTGRPTKAGTWKVKITVLDSVGVSAKVSFTLTVTS